MTGKKDHSIQITRRFLQAMDRIIGNRTDGKVTAKQFGDVVGINSSNISRLRNATRDNFVTVEAIGRICEHYHVSATWLITGKGEQYNNDELYAANKALESRVSEAEKAISILEKEIAAMRKTKNK